MSSDAPRGSFILSSSFPSLSLPDLNCDLRVDSFFRYCGTTRSSQGRRRGYRGPSDNAYVVGQSLKVPPGGRSVYTW
eukprot:786575-Amphidinium_carterae.1